MKNIKNSLYILFFAALFTSCVDEGDSFLVDHRDPDNFAPFISLQRDSPIIDFSDPNASYDFTLSDPSGANVVASYAVAVSWTSAAGTSDTIAIETITSFPAEVSYSLPALATVLGVSADDFAPGDSFLFWATTTGTNGVVTTFEDLVGDAQNSQGLSQALRHVVFIACPFVQADAIGNYAIVTDGFPASLDPTRLIEAVAGPDENSATLLNPFSHVSQAFEMTIDVEPATGIASVAQQQTFSTTELVGIVVGTDFGVASHDGGGFFFSCAGFITLTLRTTVAAGSFGSQVYEFQKQ